MRFVAWILCLACVACERADAPRPVEAWEPFESPGWTTFPPDEQFVEAYVGRGGTDAERARFRAFVASVLRRFLLRSPSDDPLHELEVYKQQLRQSRQTFTRLVERYGLTPREAAYLVVVEDAAGIFHGRAWQIGIAETHKDLWPTERYEDRWPFAHESLEEVRRVARDLEAEFAAFRAQAETIVPRAFASTMAGAPPPYDGANYFVRMTYDSLRIATGQGYDRSCCNLYEQLVSHGVPTTLTPEPPEL